MVRVQLRHTLDQDPTGVNGLRAVALIGQDEESLAIWSRNALQSGESGWGVSYFVCAQLTPSQMSCTHPLSVPIATVGYF